jgi:hypothetical protein
MDVTVELNPDSMHASDYVILVGHVVGTTTNETKVLAKGVGGNVPSVTMVFFDVAEQYIRLFFLRNMG